MPAASPEALQPSRITPPHTLGRLGLLTAAIGILLLGYLLLFPNTWDWPVEHYQAFHISVEVFAIVIACTIFATGWHLHDERRASGSINLAVVFLSVALFDLLHLLSFPGMPDFITPNTTHKGIVFWLAARLCAAVGLLLYVLHPHLPMLRARLRNRLLVINLLLVSSVAGLVLFMPDTLPQTYVPGQGLTPLKIGLESLVIALHILTLVVLIPRTRTTGLSRQQQALVYALVLSAISEAFFMLYAQYNDLANLAGHLYKILAYVFLYQAIFLESVRGPIERLQEAQAAERSSSQRYRELIEQAPDAILVVNQHGHIEMINERLEALFGYSRDTLIGQPIEVLVPSPYRESHRQQRDAFLHAPQGQPMTNRTNVEGLHRDGRHIPLNINLSSCEVDGEPKVTAFIRDVSEWRSMENELRHMATHDALTGLPNRTLFADRLTHDLAQAQRGGYVVAVVMMDLDHFKDINDTWGHAAGDALLVEAARRLSSVLRSNDTICRIGGDEFALILPNIHVPEDVTRVADKIHEQFMQPFCLSGHDVTINATLGASLYPEDGDNGEQLLANADVAMYAGKAQARGSLRFYTEAMNREVRDNLLLQARLKHALSEAHGGLALYYQPQVDLVSGRLKGFEALFRWHDEVLGQVSPARLIPVAEGSGMIVPLGYWILEQACRQIRTWMTAGTPVRVAVNLSPRQFREQDLVERIRILLLSVDIPAHLLELEVTEGALMDDPDRATAMLSELAGLGICLSIDDFGTGYSSLSYLKQFPIHKLKIDQSFVRELPEDQNSASIVRSIIGLAHSMRLEVIAEGVETFDQLQFLRDAGCEEYQGYFFSRPVPATECTAMLSRADDPARLH